jgi:hypothetical protein
MNRATRIFSIGLLAVASTACGRQEGASAAGADTNQATADSGATPAEASAPAAKAEGGILDACSLVTQADAESILGVPAKLSEREKDDKYASHCSYEAVDQASGVNLLGVEIHTDEDAKDARTGLAINSKLYSNNSAGNIYLYEALTGIGDDAFMVSNKPPAGMPAEMLGMISDQQMVFAIKGAKDIHIITSYSGKPRTADTLKALAKKLADHI